MSAEKNLWETNNRLLTDSSVGYKRTTDIREAAVDVVSNFNFSVLELYADLLKDASQDKPISETFDSWMPDPLRDVILNGGSDCFGLALLLKEKLSKIKVKSYIFPFSTRGLLAEEDAKDLLSDVGSVGVIVQNGTNDFYFIDPGFALVEPLTITKTTESISYKLDGRTFTIRLTEGKNGTMSVVGVDGLKKEIDFRGMETLSESSLDELQKQYIRIRPTVQIEKFNEIGEKMASVKVQMLKNEIFIMNGDVKINIPYAKWNDFNCTDVAQKLGVNPDDLRKQISTIIHESPRLRSLWVESLRKIYADKHYAPLQEELSTWEEARQKGYDKGGVVVMLKNNKNELLMYRVPESRQKPKIGRLAGQYNVGVETAEDDEEYDVNVIRAFKEEFGLDAETCEANVAINSYRETDYGSGDRGAALARCVVCEWKGDLDYPFSFENGVEGGKWEWVPIDQVTGHDLEPNLRPILERHILEGLL